jgi:hypothetical protein
MRNYTEAKDATRNALVTARRSSVTHLVHGNDSVQRGNKRLRGSAPGPAFDPQYNKSYQQHMSARTLNYGVTRCVVACGEQRCGTTEAVTEIAVFLLS